MTIYTARYTYTSNVLTAREGVNRANHGAGEWACRTATCAELMLWNCQLINIICKSCFLLLLIWLTMSHYKFSIKSDNGITPIMFSPLKK